jgi:hypothetical protein
MLQNHHHRSVPTTRLIHYRTAADFPVQEEDLSEKDIVMSLQLVAAELKQSQQKHRELRASHLEQLAEAIVLQQSPSLHHDSVEHIKAMRTEKQFKLLIKQENIRKSFRKLGQLFRPQSTKSLIKIDVPDAEVTGFGDPMQPQLWRGPWKTITQPNEISKIVASMNKKQYNQAQETPFGSGPLAQALGRWVILQLQKEFYPGIFLHYRNVAFGKHCNFFKL